MFNSIFFTNLSVLIIIFALFYTIVMRYLKYNFIGINLSLTSAIVKLTGSRIEPSLSDAVAYQQLSHFLRNVDRDDFLKIVVYDSEGKLLFDTNPFFNIPTKNDNLGLTSRLHSSIPVYNLKANYLDIAYPYLKNGVTHKYTYQFLIKTFEMKREMRRLFLTLIFGLLVSFGILFVMAIQLSNIFASPITSLYERIKLIKQGKDVDLRLDNDTEIGEFSNFLNNTFVELKKSLRKLEKSNKIKDEFLANVTHELKTPLTASKGYVEYILSGRVKRTPEKVKKYLQIVLRNLARLEDRIEKLIDISSLKEGHNQKFLPFSINVLIDEVLLDFKERIQSKGLTLIKDTEEIPVPVIGNRREIRIVLENILDNALKYTDNGYIKVGCKVDNDRCVVNVEDTGIGIPDEKLGVVFDKFTRATDKSKGVGLGLSITYEIIEKHNGKIWIESSLNKGTKVFFTISLLKSEEG